MHTVSSECLLEIIIAVDPFVGFKYSAKYCCSRGFWPACLDIQRLLVSLLEKESVYDSVLGFGLEPSKPVQNNCCVEEVGVDQVNSFSA